MSVHIPIYKRILYDSVEINSKQSKDSSVSPTVETSHDLETRLAPLEREIMSAPSFHFSPGDSLQQGQILPRSLSSAPSLSVTKFNGERQTERLKERERHLNQTRTLKRTSNIIAHRQDQGYFISGSSVPLTNKYDIEEEELIRLRMLAHSRAEKSTSRTNSRNTSASTRKFSSGGSPSGQTSSPVPPLTTTTLTHAGKKSDIKDERERRKELQRNKEREKQKRLEEKERFEKEMEEKYKPKKPVQKSMIFITENNDKDMQRTFLTDGDFMEDEEKGAIYSFINENQRNAFTSIFNEMDKNKDGKVDMHELKQNLSSLVSKKNLKYLLQVFDLNQDHTVDVREFVTICALNDKLCGIRTENETASLALDLERLAQHITIYKELFTVVDEDGDGRVQPDEVLLLVMTALEGENVQENMEENNTTINNTQDESTEDNTNNEYTQGSTETSGTNGHNTEEENTQNESTKEINTNNDSTKGNTETNEHNMEENTQKESTKEINTNDQNTQGNTEINRTNGHNTKEENVNENNTEKSTKKVKIQIDREEAKQVLDSIEKDENGFIDFVSFLSYIPFFTQLLKVIMDSPLSIQSLEKTRDKVTRKLSRNTTQSS